MTNNVSYKDFPFETLIKGRAKKSNTEKWYPTPIDDYRSTFKIDTTIDTNEALLNNICYNMQYLEFLEKELQELELSSVIRAITIKNYVLTSMSILEGLFTYIVKANGLWTKNAKEMKLIRLIQVLEEHGDTLNINASIYTALQNIRKLRNKIHLTCCINNKDHDYNIFTE